MRFPWFLDVTNQEITLRSREQKLCYTVLFKCSTSWRFCTITMLSSSSDGPVRRAIASEIVDLRIIPSPVKPKAKKLVFTTSLFDAQH